MVVVFVIPRLRSGGAEHVMRLIADNLSIGNRGWRVILVSLLDSPSEITRVAGSPLEFEALGCSRVSLSALSLRSLLVHSQAKVVVSTLPHVIRMVAAVKVSMMGKFHHIARLANTYSQQIGCGASNIFDSVVLTRTVNRYVDHFIAVSAGVARDYERSYRVPAERISVINNPIDPRAFAYSNREDGGRDFKRILAVGRLVDQKNFRLALSAFEKLVQEINCPLRLTFVGDGPQRAMLLEIAEALGVAQSVEFVGYQRNVGDFYSTADVLLLTSLYEGFPNVIVEALHHGIPVVSVDCKSGPSEILTDRRLGRVVGYDSRQIADSLKYYLENMSDRASIEYRKHQIVKRFSIDRIVSEYRSVIEEGANRRRAHAHQGEN